MVAIMNSRKHVILICYITNRDKINTTDHNSANSAVIDEDESDKDKYVVYETKIVSGAKNN